MSQKEAPRPGLVRAAEQGRITNAEGAQAMGLSVRQFRRLRAVFRDQGAQGLAHGNRGRPSPRRTSNEERQRIVNLMMEDQYPFLKEETGFLKQAVEADRAGARHLPGSSDDCQGRGGPRRQVSQTRRWAGAPSLLTDRGKDDTLFKGLPSVLEVLQWHGEHVSISLRRGCCWPPQRTARTRHFGTEMRSASSSISR